MRQKQVECEEIGNLYKGKLFFDFHCTSASTVFLNNNILTRTMPIEKINIPEDFIESMVEEKNSILTLSLKEFICETWEKLQKEDIFLNVYINNKKSYLEISSDNFLKVDDRKYNIARIILTDKKNKKNTVFKQIELSSLTVDFFSSLIAEFRKELIYLRNETKRITLQTNILLTKATGGYFIHETVGHLLEEDYFYNYKLENVFKNVEFPQFLSVEDTPLRYENALNLNRYDDAGTKLAAIKLIENGSLKEIIEGNKGVYRRESIYSKLLPRMRATFIKPFNHGNSISIGNNNHYVIITDIYNGQVIPSTQQFFLQGKGYLIHDDGKSLFSNNILITGNSIETLRNVVYIGDSSNFEWKPVLCHKMGQTIPVVVGSPDIEIEKINIQGDFVETNK
ncbi:metallopeptidase TldD-related protein [Niallia sp. 01092]|uniref:metallopeptidase TldD-related protein n=1 Tax=Niallia sp. 01092 TaxID=3457759 RepID=UPI003FCF7C70